VQRPVDRGYYLLRAANLDAGSNPLPNLEVVSVHPYWEASIPIERAISFPGASPYRIPNHLDLRLVVAAHVANEPMVPVLLVAGLVGPMLVLLLSPRVPNQPHFDLAVSIFAFALPVLFSYFLQKDQQHYQVQIPMVQELQVRWRRGRGLMQNNWCDSNDLLFW
jgi:hypothetical protein